MAEFFLTSEISFMEFEKWTNLKRLLQSKRYDFYISFMLKRKMLTITLSSMKAYLTRIILERQGLLEHRLTGSLIKIKQPK